MAQRLPVLYNKKPCYDIVFQQSFDGLWEELQELGASEKKLCIVTDSRVDELYGAQVAELLEGKCRKIVKYAFPAGEENKNLETVKDVYRFLIEEGFDRKDMLKHLFTVVQQFCLFRLIMLRVSHAIAGARKRFSDHFIARH